jgi:hypothetical protein
MAPRADVPVAAAAAPLNSRIGALIDPADWEDGTAKQYAVRDVEMFPTKTLSEWRAEIDKLLDEGAPYGKMVCWDYVIDAMEEWRIALQNVAKGAHPYYVYREAPEDCLTFLGY